MGNDFLCSLCLCTIRDKNFNIIEESMKEVLDVIFTNKSLTKTQAICQICSKRIQNIFNFKCTCIYTEDFLIPFTNGIAASPINLKELYMRKNGNSINVNSQQVCRLCLQLVDGYFTSLSQGTERDMLQKYLPELAIQNTLDPIACRTCIESVYDYATFITDCINAQEKKCGKYENEQTSNMYLNNNYKGIVSGVEINERGNINNDKASQTMISISDLDFCAKSENEIKSERDDGSCRVSYYADSFGAVCEQKQKEIDIKYSNLQQFLASTCTENRINLQASAQNIELYKPEQLKQEIKEEFEDNPSVLYDLDLHMVRTKEENDRKPSGEARRTRNGFKKPTDVFKNKMYECDECHYQTKYASALKSHVLIHKRPSEIKMFKCDQCDYKTKYRNALKSHQLNHERPSEIKMYKCDYCDYKTKYRNALKSHQLNHKPSEEIQMRKCNLCTYETKHRTALVLHMLKHKSPNEIVMYKCDQCQFQTKFKHALKPHKLKHKNKT